MRKTHYSLLSIGSTQEDRPNITEKRIDWGVKNQIKQTKKINEIR